MNDPGGGLPPEAGPSGLWFPAAPKQRPRPSPPLAVLPAEHIKLPGAKPLPSQLFSQLLRLRSCASTCDTHFLRLGFYLRPGHLVPTE